MLSKSEIKYIQSLHHKKFRDSHETFIAEGPKVVEDLLKQEVFTVKKIFALENWVLENESTLHLGDNEINIVQDFELEKLSLLKNPNQVIAILRYRNQEAFSPEPENVTLMLDEIRDPGNFGTIIRTADWFGIKNIVCSKGCVDMYNPKVVQGTMASIGRVRVHYSSLTETLDSFPEIPLYSAALRGESPDAGGFARQGFLLIGNEGSGISEELMARSARLVTIPGFGEAESLNAAVATGILLYAFTRRR